jgi:hypothetical protein
MNMEESAQEVFDKVARWRRAWDHQEVVRHIEIVLDRYQASTNELAAAIGVYFPALGKSGQSLVAKWRTGYELPSDKYRLMLKMLARHELGLREIPGARSKGKRGRKRRTFEVVVGDESPVTPKDLEKTANMLKSRDRRML